MIGDYAARRKVMWNDLAVSIGNEPAIWPAEPFMWCGHVGCYVVTNSTRMTTWKRLKFVWLNRKLPIRKLAWAMSDTRTYLGYRGICDEEESE